MEDCFAYQNGKCKVLKVKSVIGPIAGFIRPKSNMNLTNKSSGENCINGWKLKKYYIIKTDYDGKNVGEQTAKK